MKQFLYIILLALAGNVYAQDTIECITIDFETLPNGLLPFEGRPISEEYRDSFGLYFELDNGEVPVLAEVGFPATAFASTWGDDMPAPGVDLGQFFLTDDGILFTQNSTFAIPIVIRFDTPVDTFSGCIMDMDWGEEFIIHARDIDDNVILADTIRDGDPGTGDGQATCWGFNLPDCSGTIYSIRYEGFRETGNFGMGLDNLTFCTGIDVNTQISSVTTAPTCDSLVSGSLEIINSGPGIFQYSIDGGPYQDEPIFEDITAGEHIITFLESRGCIESLPFYIEGPQLIELLDQGVQHTTCAEDNGVLTLLANLADSVQYSINGVDFQFSSRFENLGPGDYDITIMDKHGCIFEDEATIDPSTLPEIQDVEIGDDYCSNMVGSIRVTGSGGTGSYEYSINGGPRQAMPDFENLPGGEYLITLFDEDNCIVETMVDVISTPEISDLRIAVDHPLCKQFNGAIRVSAQGGSGEIQFSINGAVAQTSGTFENLAPGTYTVEAVDEAGCLRSSLAELDVPLCPVWIPNVFSPNNDANNDLFTIGTVDDYDLGIIEYAIYDRWGELVFLSNNFSIYSNDYWWDGLFLGEPAEIGVYAYLIEVVHPTGATETFTGDVTLLK